MIILKRFYHFVGYFREGFVNSGRFLRAFFADMLFLRRSTTLKDLSGRERTRYPAIDSSFQKSFCLGCTFCVQSCPTGALEWDKSGNCFLHKDLCLNCGVCQEVCPKNWISHAVAEGSTIGRKRELIRCLTGKE